MGITTAVAWIATVAWVLSLAWEIPHAIGMAKKKKREEKEKKNTLTQCCVLLNFKNIFGIIEISYIFKIISLQLKTELILEAFRARQT